jgi:hypothetical protein
MKMVLCNPRGIKAQALGVNDLLRRQSVALRCRYRVKQAGEERETLEFG